MKNEPSADITLFSKGINSLTEFTTSAVEVITTTDYWFGIITSITLLFIRHRIKLPNVRVNGGGSGSQNLENGERFSVGRVTITNYPRFIGYPVSRETLSVASARIFNPATRQFEGSAMRWEGEQDNKPFKTEIPVGESGSLFVYGAYEKRVHHYSGTTVHNINLSETLVEMGQERKLEIHIFDTLQRKYKIPFKISAKEKRNHVNGFDVQIRVKTTFTDRLRSFKYGFTDMIRAFTSPGY